MNGHLRQFHKAIRMFPLPITHHSIRNYEKNREKENKTSI